MRTIALIFSVNIFCLNSCPGQQRENNDFILSSAGAYFDQEAPVDVAGLFMNEVISKYSEAEMCGTFSENGTAFYYNAELNGNWTIFLTSMIDGKWCTPKPIGFTDGFTDRDFTISPDGRYLYFGSNRPRTKGEVKQQKLDLFVSKKMATGDWSEPTNLGSTINTEYSENYPSIDSAGNLYFFSNRNEGLGKCEIYMSVRRNGQFEEPKLLDDNINSDKNDWDSFIAKDNSYIIFSSQNRDDTMGLQDLYISFKDKNGKWTEALNMGSRVNSTADEICPNVSSDGKYFFFTSRRRGLADIFWIDAGIIEDLRIKRMSK